MPRIDAQKAKPVTYVCEKCGDRAQLHDDVPVYLDQGMFDAPCGGEMRPLKARRDA